MPDLVAAKQISKADFYPVVAGQDVYLDVVVGYGDPAAIAVSLDKAPVAHGPSVSHQKVGGGAQLAGKQLLVMATVVDASSATDQTAVTCKLSGGTFAKEIAATATADAGGAVIYGFLINLI